MPTDSDLSFDQLIELERRAAERERAGGGDGGHDPGGTGGGGGGGDGDPGGVVVLPWWQRPFNIGVVVFTAAALAAMVGWMVGDAMAQPDTNEVDIGFLQDMREHHEQAIFMSQIFLQLDDTDAGMRQIARTIQTGQQLEVGRFIQMLRFFGETEVRVEGVSMDWMSDHSAMGAMPEFDLEQAADDGDFGASQMPGMATDEQLEALTTAQGRAADELFGALMITHHQAGADMAQYAADHAANSEVTEMAVAMAHAQRGEIVEIQGVLGG